MMGKLILSMLIRTQVSYFQSREYFVITKIPTDVIKEFVL